MQYCEIDPDAGWMAAGIITIKTSATGRQPNNLEQRNSEKSNQKEWLKATTKSKINATHEWGATLD